MGDETQPADPTAVILARMEVKLDHALASVTDHESRLRKLEDRPAPAELTDHEARIRILEKRSIQFATVAATLGALGGGGLAQLFQLIGGQ